MSTIQRELHWIWQKKNQSRKLFERILKADIVRQFTTFGFVGAIGTIGHYLTLIVLVEIFSANPVLASGCGFAVGAIINYILNYHFTFQSNQRHTETIIKFMLIAVSGAILNSIVMYLGMNILMLFYLMAQFIATVLVLLWNFTFSKYWAFASQ